MSNSPLPKAKKPPAIELVRIRKSFGAVMANEDVSISVEQGSIHAIIGENGAGKSTAMKMLYGIYSPDAGEIRIRGSAKSWRSPLDAIRAGIGMVHQHFMLADPYTALENVMLGEEPSENWAKWIPRAFRPIARRYARQKLEKLSTQYGLKVNWDKKVEALPVGIQQRLEILKLLYRDADILILDEPTAVLTPQEVVELFSNLKRLVAEGKTILIITHKLKEVMAVADRVTVLRAGKVVGVTDVKDTQPEKLAEMMVGRKVHLTSEAPAEVKPGQPLLSVENLRLKALEGGSKDRLHSLNFDVRSGEIVGIAGVEGNGQSELLQAIMAPSVWGRLLSGKITLLKNLIFSDLATWSSGRIRALDLGMIPEDRIRHGLLSESDLSDNYLLGLHRRPPFSVRGWIQTTELKKRVHAAVEAYDVRPRDPTAKAGQLSGGNQQKLIIAREFERNPRFIIAAQPTRGVDVGAIESIHNKIFEARANGVGVLLISSELDEIFALSDRILVLFEGRIVASFVRGQYEEKKVGLAMSGAGAS